MYLRVILLSEIIKIVNYINIFSFRCEECQLYVQVDIFRIENGKIVEHGGNAEPVSPKEELIDSGKN